MSWNLKALLFLCAVVFVLFSGIALPELIRLFCIYTIKSADWLQLHGM